MGVSDFDSLRRVMTKRENLLVEKREKQIQDLNLNQSRPGVIRYRGVIENEYSIIESDDNFRPTYLEILGLELKKIGGRWVLEEVEADGTSGSEYDS